MLSCALARRQGGQAGSGTKARKAEAQETRQRIHADFGMGKPPDRPEPGP